MSEIMTKAEMIRSLYQIKALRPGSTTQTVIRIAEQALEHVPDDDLPERGAFVIAFRTLEINKKRLFLWREKDGRYACADSIFYCQEMCLDDKIEFPKGGE